MEIIFSVQFSRKIWICLFVIMMHLNEGIFAERGGFLYFRFICFRNPGHYLSDGKVCDFSPSNNCDLSFRICISSHPIRDQFYQQNCLIYFNEASGYDNEESVCKTPRDNRQFLAKTAIKELPYPIQQTYYVKIDVEDIDFRGLEYVASFSYAFVQRPSPNHSTPNFVSIKMPRSERQYWNKRASMEIEMALQCDKDRYGEFCMDFCKSADYDNYVCAEDGKKKCKEGWIGENCDKSDLCLFLACAPGATCVEINEQAKCFCYGIIGQHCNLNYTPCAGNPCQNSGRCIPNRNNEVGPRCNCNFPFYGSRCEMQIDMCLVEPCHNNATCATENNVRHCVCLEGFSGKLCDQIVGSPNQTIDTGDMYWTKFTNPKLSSVIILSILFTTSVIAFLGIISIYLVKKRNKERHKFRKNKDTPIKMSDLDSKLKTPVLSNQSDVKTTVESVYDIVEDQNTYSYIKENNDFYLVPTSTFSKSGSEISPTVTSDIYLEMSHNNDIVNESDKEVNRDSQYLPPLPVRDIERRMSLTKFCLP